MALSAQKVLTVKPKEKAYKLTDERGLFLLVKPTGSKYWRFKYYFNNKEKLLALGVYPDVSLADARDRRDTARKQLANGVDPGLVKTMSKEAAKMAAENSFEAVAREWHTKFSSKWTEDHGKRILIRLEKDIFPWLGSTPINEITPPKLLTVLRRIESRGAVETAHRAHQNCSQIFRYAIATGRAERDSAADLRGALQPV